MNPGGLKPLLDRLTVEYARVGLSIDPLEIVRRYEDPADRETAGLTAAMLALGRADLIRRALSEVLAVMGPSPGRFARNFEPARDAAKFRGFVYRFFRDRDLSLLMTLLRETFRGHGSVGALFEKGFRPDHADVGPALSAFVRGLESVEAPRALRASLTRGSGLRAFLADPATGSACKRLNLYLRWMVRKDAFDFGLWRGIPPSRLVIPLDTHIARLGKRLGLTGRATPDWKMALEITASLRRLDPDDPVRYDFALCTIGKLHACPDCFDCGECRACPLAPWCLNRPGTASAAASGRGNRTGAPD